MVFVTETFPVAEAEFGTSATICVEPDRENTVAATVWV